MRRRMDKIDCNIYEIKLEFKEFKETVVGFIDSLSKHQKKDSPTGHSYAVSKFKFNNCVRLSLNLIVV